MEATTIAYVIGAVVVFALAYVVLLRVLDRFQGRQRREEPTSTEAAHLREDGQVHDVARHPGDAARHHDDVDDVIRKPHDG